MSCSRTSHDQATPINYPLVLAEFSWWCAPLQRLSVCSTARSVWLLGLGQGICERKRGVLGTSFVFVAASILVSVLRTGENVKLS